MTSGDFNRKPVFYKLIMLRKRLIVFTEAAIRFSVPWPGNWPHLFAGHNSLSFFYLVEAIDREIT